LGKAIDSLPAPCRWAVGLTAQVGLAIDVLQATLFEQFGLSR
jgi:hypothetical protein